ncbi:MAG: hypothetical protein GEU78_14685 [Actinobacteria bacterium]|nr:hypothetical protein [Actinomycetota bacterium]
MSPSFFQSAEARRPLLKHLRNLVILGLLALLPGLPTSAPAAVPPGGAGPDVLIEPEHLAACFAFKTPERSFVRKHNTARRARGLGPLKMDIHLGKVARYHTREMTRRNSLYHTSSRQLSYRVTRWSTLGENVGVGGTVGSLFKAFMNSPAHRANILYSKFNHIGVGTLRKYGRLWVTVIFEARNNPGTRLC